MFQGSLSIVYDILKRRKKRRTTYHQLLLGISVFDIFGSTAYTLIAVMAPYEAGFYLSRGNQTTCILQGFMIQLGYTSIYYNACLSLYFVFVICHGWKETQFKQYLRYVHTVVVLVGITLAFVGIPFYGNQVGLCYVLVPPGWKNYAPISMFYTVPIGLGLLVLTTATVMICVKVYRQEKASRRWSMHKRNMKLTRKVFRQSIWYMLAFDITLPFALASTYWHYTSERGFWVLVVSGFVHPIQGFMNALVYFQRFNKAEFGDLFLVKQTRHALRRISSLVASMKRKASSTLESSDRSIGSGLGGGVDDSGNVGAQEKSVDKVDRAIKSGGAEEEPVIPAESEIYTLPTADTTGVIAPEESREAGFVSSEDHDIPTNHSSLGVVDGLPLDVIDEDPATTPTSEHQDTIAHWTEQQTRERSEVDKVFEATLEHWRVNFLDDDDDDDNDNRGPPSTNRRISAPRGSPSWWHPSQRKMLRAFSDRHQWTTAKSCVDF
mmetsp:Transcript_1171/g.3013  ORF Transcript_1171/g.3013 Transcript_1171/m.3013 type:complete len:493 (-) Transcript_1171:993-2471(-)